MVLRDSKKLKDIGLGQLKVEREKRHTLKFERVCKFDSVCVCVNFKIYIDRNLVWFLLHITYHLTTEDAKNRAIGNF